MKTSRSNLQEEFRHFFNITFWLAIVAYAAYLTYQDTHSFALVMWMLYLTAGVVTAHMEATKVARIQGEWIWRYKIDKELRDGFKSDASWPG